jgi:hypothetical protein
MTFIEGAVTFVGGAVTFIEGAVTFIGGAVTSVEGAVTFVGEGSLAVVRLFKTAGISTGVVDNIKGVNKYNLRR